MITNILTIVNIIGSGAKIHNTEAKIWFHITEHKKQNISR